MLDVYQVLPAELPGLGFDIPDQQLGLADLKEGWGLTVFDVDQAVDPFGMGGTWLTRDLVPLQRIKFPLTFHFTDMVEEILPYGEVLEDWVEQHTDPEWFLWLPKLMGNIDLPWNNHQSCGCDGDEDPDTLWLWDLWPIEGELMKVVDDLAMWTYDQFFEPCMEFVMLTENQYDPHDTDRFDRIGQLRQQLFTKDGTLKVHSEEFRLENLTDSEDLIHMWRRLRRSSSVNNRVCDRFRHSLWQDSLRRATH